jgi:hypothetical protein
MVGLFYATGLGGVKEDQGKVRLYVSSSEGKLISGLTILYIRCVAGISTCRDGFGIQTLGGNKRSGGESHVFFRHLADAQNCHTALDYYEASANRGKSILSTDR